MSLPVRGAWIEISITRLFSHTFPSLPVRGAWIEITSYIIRAIWMLSLPVRGAWIEIGFAQKKRRQSTSRSPCGERGLKFQPQKKFRLQVIVAPRAGSLD